MEEYAFCLHKQFQKHGWVKSRKDEIKRAVLYYLLSPIDILGNASIEQDDEYDTATLGLLRGPALSLPSLLS